jgi:hypothetical protein
MPRRMLRNRVIQQCARLALGISANEGISKMETIRKESITAQNHSTQIPSRKQVDVLKDKLLN